MPDHRSRRPGAGPQQQPPSQQPPIPQVPDDVSGAELDPQVRRALAGLPDSLADRVARHLVVAGRLVDVEPEDAHRHATAAREIAGRMAVVREAVGETAYACGRFAQALAELRAARRMNGSVDYLPLMADCERALGRPGRALTLARDSGVARLGEAGRIEMTIVAAGARRDLGEPAAALSLLEAAPLHTRSRAPWVPRLHYAYADTLLELGRRAEAREWFARAEAADPDSLTDSADRVAALTDESQRPAT